MSAGFGVGESSQKSSSGSPIQGNQNNIANLLQMLFQHYLSPGSQAPAFAGVPAAFNDIGLNGNNDILQNLLGGGSNSTLSPAAAALHSILSGGSAVPTSALEDPIDAYRRQQLSQDYAGINEQMGTGGLRFSTANDRLKSDAALRSEESFRSQIAPIRAQLSDAAQARQASMIGLLGNAGLEQQRLGQSTRDTALQDQRYRETGILPYALQYLSAGIPQSQSKGNSKNFNANAGVAGGGG